MSRMEPDDDRENRITNEIIVDTYNEEEQAVGWYTYLGDNLMMPKLRKQWKAGITG